MERGIMSENKVSLKGLDNILKLFTSWLITPEERKLYAALAEEKLANAEKTQSDIFTKLLKEIAKTKALELKTLRETVELYKSVGYSEAEMRMLLEGELKYIWEAYDALTILKELKKNGVILDFKVRQLEPPSKSEDPEEP